MPAEPDLILASASPRRLELLERVGLVPLVIPADVDETPLDGEKPIDYARRVAGSKCDAIAGGPATQGRALAVVGADTTVVVDDAILGKPVDESDARAMLGRLAGRRHEVVTAYRIRHLARTVERAVTTAVFVRSLHPAEIDAYLVSWRVARQGRRLRGPGDRRCLRDRAARLRHQRGRPARWPSCWPICRRSAPSPPTRGRDSRRRDPRGRDRRRTGGGSHPHRSAERAAGRAPGSVQLIAVSKKMPADDVRAAIAAGQRAFGENYGQELRDKRAETAADPVPPEWHFIGPLQSNKVKYVAGQVALVHTVDSVALLEAIEGARASRNLASCR